MGFLGYPTFAHFIFKIKAIHAIHVALFSIFGETMKINKYIRQNLLLGHMPKFGLGEQCLQNGGVCRLMLSCNEEIWQTELSRDGGNTVSHHMFLENLTIVP
jgi:hypothetical protein